MRLRFHTAVIVGKSVAWFARLTGNAGGALPGLVAERVDPQVLSRLSAQCTAGVILVSGTNGKTTTSRLLANILEERHPGIVHNRSGSNMSRGHVAAFLSLCSWSGGVKADCALLEVDEAVLPAVIAATKPSVVVLHNLFRDQLDRYGEVDSLVHKWLAGVKEGVPDVCSLVVNADDPNLAFIARESGHQRIFYYGLDDVKQGKATAISTVDAYLSPYSKAPLVYRHYYLSHLGDYTDPESHFKRPKLNLAITDIALDPNSSHFSIDKTRFDLQLPGLYNVYNAAAALAVAEVLGFNLDDLPKSIEKPVGAFGRFERINWEGHEYVFCLIKNPVGATEVLQTIGLDKQPLNLALFAHDNFADGQDVSWYWDTRFELIAPQVGRLLCGGLRGNDMALRMKYAGNPVEPKVVQTVASGIDYLLSHTYRESVGVGARTYVLSTYTATLDAQRLLAARGVKTTAWQEQ